MQSQPGSHWTFRSISRATLPTLTLLTAVAVGSGLLLATFEEALYQYPSLLILVPVTIGTAGNLGSLLASRLSTAFHLGTLSFRFRDEQLGGHSLATVALALTLFPLVGAGAWILALVTGRVVLPLWRVVLISTTSGAGLAAVAIVATVLTTYGAYQAGLDPDDVVIPVVTVLADVFGVVMLFLTVSAFT
ncbi:magnesium transporter [Halodesulfurarchaeum sp. HSR-GB]|uniref:magnesium transporter n=1 Tax=Halodesulfurarchaeum sp. HSR-GB TaxID=3074077 RepID=UPI00286665B1|nr:magnesium transporter [Halodesulfurarchaeum sp. HSR-GB]MDR5656181.1 magnesium transporter [Halodesulfurarchaeum sp. HSR-GB]